MDQKLSADEIICNRCGSCPEIITTDLGSMHKGVRCNECKNIECLNCKGLPPDRPCSWCGGKVSPIGYVNKPVSTGVSHSAKCPYCAKEIDEDAFVCPNCGRAVVHTKHSVQVFELKEPKIDVFRDKDRGLSIEAKLISSGQLYYPGDVVRIEVKINCEKRTKVSKINANLVLRKTTVTDFLGKKMVDHNDQVIATQVVLRKEIPAEFSKTYDIELLIPTDATPTYLGSRAIIVWFVTVTHALSWDLGEINLINAIEIVVPLPDQKTTSFEKTKKGKKVEMTLKLPRLSWVVGEKIQGQLLVRPLVSDLGPIQVHLLLQNTELFVNTEYKIIASDLLTDKAVPRLGEFTEYPFELEIPEECQPSAVTELYNTEWTISAAAGKDLFSTGIRETISVYKFPPRDKREARPYIADGSTVYQAQIAASLVASSPTKTCPKCAEKIMIEALVCRFCDHQFTEAEVQATKQQLETQKQEAKRLADEEAALRKIEAKKKSRRTWGYILAIVGGMLFMVGFCLGSLAVIGRIAGTSEQDIGGFMMGLSCLSFTPVIIGLGLLSLGIYTLRKKNNLDETPTQSVQK